MKLTNLNEIINIVHSLKSSHQTGYDVFNTINLKNGIRMIAEPLVQVTNQQIVNETFADELKIAKVVPIFFLKKKTEQM